MINRIASWVDRARSQGGVRARTGILCAGLACGLLLAPGTAAADGGLEVGTGCSPLQPPEGPGLCGRITLPGGGQVQYYFELGTTSNYGQDFPPAPGAEIAISPSDPSVDVTVIPSGLSPETTYHYRLHVIANGEALESGDSVFRTPPAEPPQPPEAPLTESCPGPLSPTEKRLCGTLNPNSSARVGYYFALNVGASCTGGGKLPGEDVEGESVGVSVGVTGLLPDTQYTYCLVATNSSGQTFGQALTFKSDSPPPGELPTGIAYPLVAALPSALVQPAPEAKASKVATTLKRCKEKPRKQRSRCKTRVRQLIER